MENATDTTQIPERKVGQAAPQSDFSKVNPPHYNGDRVMRVIEEFELDFCKGNSVKYLLRAGRKEGETELEDLMKARWYLDRRLMQLRHFR